MEITINVHITGLDKLADAIASLSATKTGTPTPTNTMIASVQNVNPPADTGATVNPTPASAPAAATTMQPTGTPPVSAPVSVPTTQQAVNPPAQTAPVAPAATPAYTMDELARAGAALLSDPAKAAAVMALPQQFGVQSLQNLPPERFGDLANALRGLGAVI